MPLVISLPGLLARDAFPPLRSLARLIAAAHAPSREPHGVAAALAPIYGVERQTDWPLAPIRLAALGHDPGNAYWLAADPVTLVAGLDDLRLEGAVRDLACDDAQALIATLNAHFESDGIFFVAPRPDAWFVRAASPPALATHPLESALGRSLRARLPEGADARTWNRWQNEMQMLLFEHPVNVARDREGKRPANSVWLEFGGVLPARHDARANEHVRTWTDAAAIAALARFAGADEQPVPSSLDSVLVNARRDQVLVVALDATIDIDRVEHAFAAPAWAALARGTLDAVTIVVDGDGEALVFRSVRPSLWSRVSGRFAQPDVGSLLHAPQALEDF